MTKADRMTGVTDTLGAVAECLDVQQLTDEEVADVAGGPEVVNTGSD